MNVRLSIALLCVLNAAGCSSSPWVRSPPPLYNSPNVVLLREHLEKDGQRIPLGHKHPIKVDPETLALLMSQLAYREDHLLKQNRKAEIFTRGEIKMAAEPLALSLGQIQPDERLRFLIVRSSWKDAIMGPDGTTGVIFSDEEGVLQIAFDKIVQGVTLPDGNEPLRIRFPDDPTELTGGSPIYPVAGMRLRALPDGTVCPRWLEVRLAELIAPEPPPPVATPDARAPPPAPATPPSATPTPASAQVGSPLPAPPVSEKEARYQKVRDRLESLKRLLKDDVLSKEQYQAEYEKAMEELAR